MALLTHSFDTAKLLPGTQELLGIALKGAYPLCVNFYIDLFRFFIVSIRYR